MIDLNKLKFDKPIILFGNGIERSNTQKQLFEFISKHNIPTVSSQHSISSIPSHPLYSGHIGSQGTRVANTLLFEADFVLVLGNSLSFNNKSLSFEDFTNKLIVQIDIDEFQIEYNKSRFKNLKTLNDVDSSYPTTFLLNSFFNETCSIEVPKEWLNRVNSLEEQLGQIDTTPNLEIIRQILEQNNDNIFSSDAGINDRFIKRAFHLSRKLLRNSKLLVADTFGCVGSSIGQAIGGHFGSNKNSIAFIGDEGFQMSFNELQLIKNEKLPISIVVINNNSASLISVTQKNSGLNTYLSTPNDGFKMSSIEKISNAFDFEYHNSVDTFLHSKNINKIFELTIDGDELPPPYLNQGKKLNEMG